LVETIDQDQEIAAALENIAFNDDDDDFIKILNDPNDYEIPYHIFYAKKENPNLHLILRNSNYLELYKFIDKNIFSDDISNNINEAIKYLAESFCVFKEIKFQLLLQYNKDESRLVKSDGLCGFRVIFMFHKYVNNIKNKNTSTTETVELVDVDLTNEMEYNEFFEWIRSKYKIAIKELENIKTFCIKNKIEDKFTTNEEKYPKNEETMESYKKDVSNSCLYRNEFSHKSLFEFIEWYHKFEKFIKDDRSYETIKNNNYSGLLLPQKLWFDANWSKFMCFNEDFSLLIFTNTLLEFKNPLYNVDYFNLQDLISTTKNLSILTMTNVNMIQFNFDYYELINLFKNSHSKFRFGIYFSGDHFYPITLPSELDFYEVFLDISKHVIHQYLIDNEKINTLDNVTLVENFSTLNNNMSKISKVTKSFEAKIKNYEKVITDKNKLLNEKNKKIQQLKIKLRKLKKKVN
jgi:hypothetical protein